MHGPVLYKDSENNWRWMLSYQRAALTYFRDKENIFAEPENFNRLPIPLLDSLMRGFDATTVEELWESFRRNITYDAPGDPLHETVPAFPPEQKRSTCKTRPHGLRVIPEKAKDLKCPPQMQHIALWLADQHPDKVLSDAAVFASLLRMQKINRMATRQDPYLVFKYYRRALIIKGVLEEVK